MRPWRLPVALAAAVLLSGSCSSSRTNEDGTGGVDGSAGAAGSAGATAGAGGSGGADAGPDADGGVQCPAGMVWLTGTLCIDRTEVTNAEYAAWFATTGGTPNLAEPCAWKLDLAVSSEGACAERNLNDEGPVTCVDWCEAFTYCRTRGKHLCGQRKGGAVTWGNHTDADLDEWHFACTNGGKTVYPYGDQYAQGVCSDSSESKALPSNTALKPDCHGTTPPFDQVMDLSGNAAEWVNLCTETASDESDKCLVRGGAVGPTAQDPASLRCAGSPVPDGGASPDLVRRDVASPFIGFRCCWDATVDP